MALNLQNYRLCYVEDHKAYFSSKPAKDMWGDDWDDAPYECNAGRPYGPKLYNCVEGTYLCPEDWTPKGKPKFTLFYVFFMENVGDTIFSTPDIKGTSTEEYSVEAINNGATPWLRARAWDDTLKDYREVEVLNADATYPEFEAFITRNGGQVYSPSAGIKPYPEPRPDLPLKKR